LQFKTYFATGKFPHAGRDVFPGALKGIVMKTAVLALSVFCIGLSAANAAQTGQLRGTLQGVVVSKTNPELKCPTQISYELEGDLLSVEKLQTAKCMNAADNGRRVYRVEARHAKSERIYIGVDQDDSLASVRLIESTADGSVSFNEETPHSLTQAGRESVSLFPVRDVVCENDQRIVRISRNLTLAVVTEAGKRVEFPVSYRFHSGGQGQILAISILGLDNFDTNTFISDMTALASGPVPGYRARQAGFGTQILERFECSYL